MSLLIAEEVSHARPPRAPRVVLAARLRLLLTLASLLQLACVARVDSSQVGRAAATPAPPPATEAKAEAKAETVEIRVGDSLVSDALTYAGYTVRRRDRKLKDGDAPGGEGLPTAAYAVLERGGKVVRTFDAGVHNGGLNSVGFGLFAFLGGAEKQLIVSQDAPRDGRQWIVSLSPRPRVIYDGPAFAAGREVYDLRVEDFDGDGVYELAAPLTTFYGFDDWALTPAATPLPEVIFRYDEKAGRYVPANARFRERLLKDVEAAKSKVRGPGSREEHLADVLAVVLAYVLAGEERAAWDFYEAAYKLPDKAKVQREIETELRAQPVYRFIYRERAASKV
ncbi:MAG TPA: hypothetical protein VF588_20050 [Pyrinomonadaceae bacterium]|jgi:hypothetical protein